MPGPAPEGQRPDRRHRSSGAWVETGGAAAQGWSGGLHEPTASEKRVGTTEHRGLVPAQLTVPAVGVTAIRPLTMGFPPRGSGADTRPLQPRRGSNWRNWVS